MPTSPYIDGTGNLRQRSLASGNGSSETPDIADFAPKYLNDTPITGASMPSGGAGTHGWLSAIWKFLTDSFSRPTIIYATGTISSSGDNTVISAPGSGISIYISHLVIQNESSTATTVTLKDSTNRLRYLGQSQGSSLVLTFPERRELRLATNTPLILNLSGANAVGYSFGYYTGS